MYKYNCDFCNVISELDKAPKILIDEIGKKENERKKKRLDELEKKYKQRKWWQIFYTDSSFYYYPNLFILNPIQYTQCPICKSKKYF